MLQSVIATFCGPFDTQLPEEYPHWNIERDRVDIDMEIDMVEINLDILRVIVDSDINLVIIEKDIHLDLVSNRGPM
tara:strand:- start:80 stop:307 length:228 start_codon:yes stop_codon:yes gene_type:complete